MQDGRAQTAYWRRCNLTERVGALVGKRVVVTRRADQAVAFCTALKSLGAEPLLVPAIECTALESAALAAVRHALATYDWVLLTSTNAVRFFLADLSAPLPPLAAVGPKTAAAIQALGHAVSAQPDRATGIELARALGRLDGKRVLLPRSRRGRPEIVAALREAGAQVEDLPVYDTVDARPTPAMLAQLRAGVDVVTFTSPSTVQSFLRHVDHRLWHAAVVACIGPTTAAAAEDLGLVVQIVPDEYTVAGLVDAIRAYFTRGD